MMVVRAGRMPEERIVKTVFKNIPEGEWSVGKPRKRWLDDEEKQLGIDMLEKWILKKTKVLHGPYSQRSERERERKRQRQRRRQRETERFHCQTSLTLDVQEFEDLMS
jgi:hypothetical protein